MYEFLDKHSIYIVLTIAVVIWAGISVYMFFIDSKISKLEGRMKNFENYPDE